MFWGLKALSFVLSVYSTKNSDKKQARNGLVFYKVDILIVLAVWAIEYPIIKGYHFLFAYKTKHTNII
jgi:hypothetical protein